MLRSFKLFAPVAALAIAGCNAGGSGVPATIGQSASQTHQSRSGRRRTSRIARAPKAARVRCIARF